MGVAMGLREPFFQLCYFNAAYTLVMCQLLTYLLIPQSYEELVFFRSLFGVHVVHVSFAVIATNSEP